ncbi:MAG: transglutaminase family protein [Myxococcota bacterium]
MKPWDPKGKALLLVSHTTRLRYAEPVVEAHSEVRKTPVDTGLQRVVTQKLEVTPSAPLGSYFDYFGSHVHHFNLLEPHSELTISSESVVETTDAVCCGPQASDDPRNWMERLSEYTHWSPSVPYLEAYGEIDHDVVNDLDGDAFLDALRGLGRVFRERFRYDPDATDVHSSPEVLFEKGGGVCQDLAHAMLGVLRLAGVPSRYISGYVYDPVGTDEGDAVQGAAASHAWVQAWHPGLGWVGIDPTNDKLVDWQYVRIAAGRDYTDVQPLRGVFVGPDEQALEVDVSVRRIG